MRLGAGDGLSRPRALSNEASASKNPEPRTTEVRHHLYGNLRRCAACSKIVEAVKLTALLRRAMPAPSNKRV
jgi:aerobic-type carbon monoxide dehydrogenase small subunit (CoxS/CutS family)